MNFQSHSMFYLRLQHHTRHTDIRSSSVVWYFCVVPVLLWLQRHQSAGQGWMAHWILCMLWNLCTVFYNFVINWFANLSWQYYYYNENWNKQCLLDTPRTVMVNKENYYRKYKGHTKWLSLISSHFANYICSVYAKCWRISVKALAQVDFLMSALFNRKKWLSSQSYHFVKN